MRVKTMGDAKNEHPRFSVMLPIAIQKRREELGISQAELARRLDVSRQAVSLWENGTNALDFDNLDAVCAILGLRVQIVADDTPDTLAERLRQRLNACNLSALSAAEKAGLGRDVVRDILRRKVKEPSYRSIVRLAEVLDCDPIWLGGEP
jgi:transcriptional regulator with XRE-family HTH domain